MTEPGPLADVKLHLSVNCYDRLKKQGWNHELKLRPFPGMGLFLLLKKKKGAYSNGRND
jgi:hypothetical protein